MNCKENMLVVLQHQTAAVMYHDQMSDYFRFLALDHLAEKHAHQAKKELCELRELKNCFIEEFDQLPYYVVDSSTIIPSEWKTKTSFDIDESTVKTLVKNQLEKYLERETDTLKLYKDMAKHFKEHMNYKLYRVMKEQIEDVEEEICEIKDQILDAQSYSYDLRMFK